MDFPNEKKNCVSTRPSRSDPIVCSSYAYEFALPIRKLGWNFKYVLVYGPSARY